MHVADLANLIMCHNDDDGVLNLKTLPNILVSSLEIVLKGLFTNSKQFACFLWFLNFKSSLAKVTMPTSQFQKGIFYQKSVVWSFRFV